MRSQSALAAALLEDAPASVEAARALMAGQVAMLGRLAEIGMAAAETIGARITGAAPGGDETEAAGASVEPLSEPFRGDPILALSRASRAVRMSLALRAHMIDEALRLQRGEDSVEQRMPGQTKLTVQFVDPDGGVFTPGAYRGAADPGAEDDGDLDLAGEAGDRRETAPGVETAERLIEGLTHRHRPEREALFDPLGGEPVSEIIAGIARDLGVTLNWPSLSVQPWAQRELAGGAVGKPLADFVVRPAWDPELGPPRPPRRRPYWQSLPAEDGGQSLAGQAARPGEPPS